MRLVSITEKIQVLHQDENLVVVYKPSGYHVHPHEDDYPVPRKHVCLYVVRDMINQYLYPVHRLDAPTCGVLLFALNSESAKDLATSFQNQLVEKTYYAVVRGWVQDHDIIDLPLELDSTNELVPATTEYQCLSKIEVPIAVGKRHSTARYSLVKVHPKTGRYHQIRRHFQRIHHPVIGDTRHGDSHHNRFFREHFQIQGLCLMAAELKVKTKWNPEGFHFQSPVSEKWEKLQGMFNCSVALQAFPQSQELLSR